jgi:hypothetical protein
MAARPVWIRTAICLVLVFLCLAMIAKTGSYQLTDTFHALVQCPRNESLSALADSSTCPDIVITRSNEIHFAAPDK